MTPDDGTLVFEGTELRVSLAHTFEIASAAAGVGHTGWPAVAVTVAAASTFAEWSRDNVGRSIVASVGGSSVTKLVIKSPLTANVLMSANSGDGSADEVAALASQLQPGAL